MDSALNWTYQKRDPISYGSTLSFAILVFALINFSSPPKPPEDYEMVAFLDSPPEVKPVPEPEKKIIQDHPVVKQLTAQTPISKTPVSKTPDPVDTPLPPKVQDFHPSVQLPSPVSPPLPVVAPPVPVQPAVKNPQPPENTYVAELKAYLEKIKKYPSSREARLTHPQGTVGLSLVIARTGQLLDVHVVSTSHSNLLDFEAIKTIKAGVLPSFPDQAFIGESTHEFKVNLEYSIDP